MLVTELRWSSEQTRCPHVPSSVSLHYYTHKKENVSYKPDKNLHHAKDLFPEKWVSEQGPEGPAGLGELQALPGATCASSVFSMDM